MQVIAGQSIILCHIHLFINVFVYANKFSCLESDWEHDIVGSVRVLQECYCDLHISVSQAAMKGLCVSQMYL